MCLSKTKSQALFKIFDGIGFDVGASHRLQCSCNHKTTLLLVEEEFWFPIWIFWTLTTEDQSLRSHAVLPGALSLTAEQVWLLQERAGGCWPGEREVGGTLNARGAILKAVKSGNVSWRGQTVSG